MPPLTQVPLKHVCSSVTTIDRRLRLPLLSPSLSLLFASICRRQGQKRQLFRDTPPRVGDRASLLGNPVRRPGPARGSDGRRDRPRCELRCRIHRCFVAVPPLSYLVIIGHVKAEAIFENAGCPSRSPCLSFPQFIALIRCMNIPGQSRAD